MAGFDDALGHGPDGPTYQPPAVRRRTALDRLKAWAWYRWGLGSRPQPRYDDDHRREPRRHRD